MRTDIEHYIQPFMRVKVTDRVQDRLMDFLLDHGMQPGDPLPSEAELATRFGVSKPVVRECLRGLAAIGMVELQQGKRATMRHLSSEPLSAYLRFAMQASSEGVRDAIELRRAIETETAALAALRITPAELSRLDDVVTTLASADGDIETWVAAHVDFHVLIASASRNQLIMCLTDALRGLIEQSNRVMAGWMRDPRNFEAAVGRHRAIVDALRQHNPQTALETMRAHFAAMVEAADDATNRLSSDAINAGDERHPSVLPPVHSIGGIP